MCALRDDDGNAWIYTASGLDVTCWHAEEVCLRCVKIIYTMLMTNSGDVLLVLAMYSKSSSVLYLQGTCRDEWCPLWRHCPPSLCWSSGPPLQWRWLWMCCHLFSSWKYWRQRWPQQRQMGHHTWRGARPPWWPLQGWGHSSTPLREGVSAGTKMIEPPLWGFSSIKMSSCVLWCCMFVTFTFLLRRRVTGLPAVKIRFQVRPGHPALHPAVIIPTDTIHTINTWDTFCFFCCGTLIKTSQNWTCYDVITKTSTV